MALKGALTEKQNLRVLKYEEDYHWITNKPLPNGPL